MNPTFDISQLGLRDIHLPGAIAWWPPAIGWWLLGLSLTVLIVVLSIRYFRLRRHRAACRALQRAIDAIKAGADPSACALEASTTLRRFAMTLAQSSTDVAGLVGKRWLRYLDSRWNRSAFCDGAGQLIVSSPYRISGELAAEESLELCRVCADWVRAQPPRS